jgi:hypothetical protein
MAKPKVQDVTGWEKVWQTENVLVVESENFSDFYKVEIKGQPKKYFYGESAWSDVQRHIVDETGDMSAWGIFV